MLSYRHWVQRFEALGPRPAYLMCSLGSIRKLSALRRFIGALSAEIALKSLPKNRKRSRVIRGQYTIVEGKNPRFSVSYDLKVDYLGFKTGLN